MFEPIVQYFRENFDLDIALVAFIGSVAIGMVS